MSTADAKRAHEARLGIAAASLAHAPAAPLALAKTTSNLFRDRRAGARTHVDLTAFRSVLAHDPQAGWVDVEGMATYEDLAAWCLPRGVMPAVVPQLKTITVGGAVAGVGIEATSFRHGLVHHTMRELEVLLPHGEVVTCAPDNEHADLFFGFPNSYGSLGYATRVRLATQPVRPFVQVRHLPFDDAGVFLAALHAACGPPHDFVEGVVFGPRDFVLSTGRFVAEAPWTSDYTFERIYWRSLRERTEDYLATADYLWRWDTDWFWCSRQFGAQRPLVRKLLGRARLNSRTYARWMRWNARWGFTRALSRLRGAHPESVIQDVDIPLANAGAFLDFLMREICIVPVWACPLRGDRPGDRFPLYPLPDPCYVNFGFWDVVETRTARAPGHFNRMVEDQVLRLGGIKSLYSDSFFTPEAFRANYGGADYDALKARYDPQGRAPHLYDKCVRRA